MPLVIMEGPTRNPTKPLKHHDTEGLKAFLNWTPITSRERRLPKTKYVNLRVKKSCNPRILNHLHRCVERISHDTFVKIHGGE